MSIFGTIMSKVFGTGHPAATTPPAGGSAPEAAPPTAPASPAPPPDAPASSASAAPAGGAQVDVTQVLDGMAAKAGQKLNWKVSIVDLMKLLGMDSGLGARKELAHELGYTGDTNDSASMNIWLHKQVMAKFAAAGGKLPPDLQHH